MKTDKHMTNLQVAKLLRAIAAALELTSGDNRFRIIAYQRAADAIEHSSSEVKDLWDDGKLKDLPGVGEGIASSLDELFKTGKVRHFNAIIKPFPPALFELLEVPGIGPKTAYKLSKTLGLSKAHNAIAQLEKAAKAGQVRVIEGFGADSESDIVRSIAEYKGRSQRQLLPIAQALAQQVIDWLKKIPQVKTADFLGSLRRQAATVGDIDISVASDEAKTVIEHFKNFPKKIRVLEAGTHTASLILPNDIQVDLMVQTPKSYGSLLQHFTGSKHHNIALREKALKQGYSLSEYGIKVKNQLKEFSNEKDFYNFLGYDYIPPELREDTGELEAAHNHSLPNLVELKDIKGDLQIHSDIDVEPSHDLGESSLTDIVRQAQELGYQYLGFTEHNPSLSGHTSSQVIDLIKRKTHIIEQFKSNMKTNDENKLDIYNGLEIDIQPDGRRALPDAALDILDYACVSIHSSFRQSRSDMTNRVLKALDHPKVRFFAHPTARLINERESVELDWEKIFAFCLQNDKWLEIDAWPNRLDLPDTLVRDAVKHGVKLVIDTDSHSSSHLPYMRYGVSVARRGWATPADIINTLSPDKFSQLLKGGE